METENKENKVDETEDDRRAEEKRWTSFCVRRDDQHRPSPSSSSTPKKGDERL
jgi:hypothetical protein